MGRPADPRGLDLYLAMLGDRPIPWAVAVIDGDVLDRPVTRVALGRGGHLRVGLEDQPDAAGNLELVRAATALCEVMGRPVATLAETEALLGLPD